MGVIKNRKVRVAMKAVWVTCVCVSEVLGYWLVLVAMTLIAAEWVLPDPATHSMDALMSRIVYTAEELDHLEQRLNQIIE